MNIRLDEAEPVVHKEVPGRGRTEIGKTVHQVSLQPVEVI
jgi:hypothetical protein